MFAQLAARTLHARTAGMVGPTKREFVFYHILPLNAELNPICHLLALLGARHILHFFRIRVKLRLFSKSQKNIMKYE